MKRGKLVPVYGPDASVVVELRELVRNDKGTEVAGDTVLLTSNRADIWCDLPNAGYKISGNFGDFQWVKLD